VEVEKEVEKIVYVYIWRERERKWEGEHPEGWTLFSECVSENAIGKWGVEKNMKILCELIQFHATIVFVLLTFLSSSQSENEIAIHIPFVSLLVFNGWNKYFSTHTMHIESGELICCYLPE
jgi:hypothetical protein